MQIKFNCDRKQIADVYNDEGKCCCWLKHHTYDLGNVYTITAITGEVNTGPREVTQYFPIDILASVDKQTWTKIGECGAKGIEGYKPFNIKNLNIKARYIQFKVRGYYAIDGSKGIIYTTETTQCNEGETKCEGYDLYKCINGQWQLIEKNSQQCGYVPPSPTPPSPTPQPSNKTKLIFPAIVAGLIIIGLIKR